MTQLERTRASVVMKIYESTTRRVLETEDSEGSCGVSSGPA